MKKVVRPEYEYLFRFEQGFNTKMLPPGTIVRAINGTCYNIYPEYIYEEAKNI